MNISLAIIALCAGFVLLIKGADFLVDGAVGNVVGSNIFNIFFILGIGASIRPLPFREENNIDIGVVFLSSLLLFIFIFTG